MSRLLPLIEYTLGYIFYSSRGHDAQPFIKGPAFTQFPSPTLTDRGKSRRRTVRLVAESGAHRVRISNIPRTEMEMDRNGSN